jgi:hypothetical protein
MRGQKRGILTAHQAREIFEAKSQQKLKKMDLLNTTQLAQKYKISAKAIRDVWQGRSWLHATFDLWSNEERPVRQKVGRPKGKKDSKPRKVKVIRQSKNSEHFQSKLPCHGVYSDQIETTKMGPSKCLSSTARAPITRLCLSDASGLVEPEIHPAVTHANWATTSPLFWRSCPSFFPWHNANSPLGAPYQEYHVAVGSTGSTYFSAGIPTSSARTGAQAPSDFWALTFAARTSPQFNIYPAAMSFVNAQGIQPAHGIQPVPRLFSARL